MSVIPPDDDFDIKDPLGNKRGIPRWMTENDVVEDMFDDDGTINIKKATKILCEDNQKEKKDIREKFHKRNENKVKFELDFISASFCKSTYGGKFYPNQNIDLGSGKITDVSIDTAGNMVVTAMHNSHCGKNLLYSTGRIEFIIQDMDVSNRRRLFLLEGSVKTHFDLDLGFYKIIKFVGNRVLKSGNLYEYYMALKEVERGKLKDKKREEKVKNRAIKRIFHFD